MPVNYYWQDEDNRSSLVFKLFDSNHNLISTDSGIASDGTSNFYQRSITIPKTNLSVGVHKFTIESYRKKSDGSVTTVPMSTLTLTVTVEEYFRTLYRSMKFILDESERLLNLKVYSIEMMEIR